MSGQGSAGNVLAAACNIFLPGLGHLLQGRILAAIIIFAVVSVGYFFWFLVVPGIIAGLVHLWGIYSAAVFKPEDG